MERVEYYSLIILAWRLFFTFAQPTSTYFYATVNQIRRYDSATNVDIPLYTRSSSSIANVVFNPTLNRIAYREENVGILCESIFLVENNFISNVY